jgi:hypothetical protein
LELNFFRQMTEKYHWESDDLTMKTKLKTSQRLKKTTLSRAMSLMAISAVALSTLSIVEAKTEKTEEAEDSVRLEDAVTADWAAIESCFVATKDNDLANALRAKQDGKPSEIKSAVLICKIGSGKISYDSDGVPKNFTISDSNSYSGDSRIIDRQGNLQEFIITGGNVGTQVCRGGNIRTCVRESGLSAEERRLKLLECTQSRDGKYIEEAQRRDACAKTSRMANTARTWNQGTDMVGSSAVATAGAAAQVAAQKSMDTGGQIKAALLSSNAATTHYATKSAVNLSLLKGQQTHINRLNKNIDELEKKLVMSSKISTSSEFQGGAICMKDGACSVKFKDNYSVADIDKIKRAINEHKAARDLAITLRNETLGVAGQALKQTTETYFAAKQMKNSLNQLGATSTIKPNATPSNIPVVGVSPGPATQLNLNSSTNTDTITKKERTNPSDTDAGDKSDLPGNLGGDYGGGGVDPVADTDPKKDGAGGAKGGGAVAGGGLGGGGGGSSGGSLTPDDHSAKNPQMAGSLSNDRYESSGRPRSNSNGGSAGSSGSGKDDSMDFNSLLSKFLPGGEEKPADQAAEGIAAFSKGDRAPASDESSFLDQNVDIFQRVARTYAEKASRNEVSAE